MCVDWSAGAADPNYVRAAVNTRLVGKQLAILIEAINRHYKTYSSSIYPINIIHGCKSFSSQLWNSNNINFVRKKR